MALTITPLTSPYNADRSVKYDNGHRRVGVTVVFDSSYATGGESVRVTGSPIDAREKIVGFQLIGVKDATSAAIRPVYIPSTEKMMAINGTAGADAEVSSTTDLSAVEIYGEFIVWG